MPISVLPQPPDFSPSNGYEPVDHGNGNGNGAGNGNDSIASLKSQAKASALQSAKGASALALLNAARNQYIKAGECEGEGDLRGALTAFTKAAQLANMVFATSEFQSEVRGKGDSARGAGGANAGGVVKKEFTDFMERDSINLTSRMQAVEAKLKMLEKQKQATNNSTDGPISKPGGSIADRMRALQDSGLSISTSKSNKRLSKDGAASPNPIGSPSPNTLSFPNSSPKSSAPSLESPSSALSALTALSAPSTVPGSPLAHVPTSFSSSSAFPSSSTAINPISTSSNSNTASSYSHAHAFVSPSTFGPPSPGSSPSSSPTLGGSFSTSTSSSSPSQSSPSQSLSNSRFSVTEFNTQFPSIDELDEMDGYGAGFALPSSSVPTGPVSAIPTGRSTTSNRSSGSVRSMGTGGNRSLRSTGSAGSLKDKDTGLGTSNGADLYPSSSSGTATSSNHSPNHSPSATATPLASPTPHTALRNFIVPVERPSSTPLRGFGGAGGAGGGVWDSRPGSPAGLSAPTKVSPSVPSVPSKPSGLSASISTGAKNYGNFDDEFPSNSASASTSWGVDSLPSAPFPPNSSSSYSPNGPSPIPPSSHTSISSNPPNPSNPNTSLPIPQKNTATPRELYSYLRQDHIKVILLDVRERAEFDRGHIRAGAGAGGAVCCIEPEVLRRGNCTSDTIENSLVLAPPSEASTFNNRHKFDLVVIYDRSSTSITHTTSSTSFGLPDGSHGVGASFGVNASQNQSNGETTTTGTGSSNPDISALLRAIWEREFKKTLRRMPMMLIGGYEAWMKEFGEGEVVSSSSSATMPSSGLGSSSNGNGTGATNPFAPGGPLASPALGGSFNDGSSSSQPQVGSGSSGSAGSRARAGTSPSQGQNQPGTHKPNNYSLDQGSGSSHSRAPAESNSTSTFISNYPSSSSTSASASSSSRSGRATPTSSAPLAPHLSGSGAGGRRPAVVRASFSSSSSSSTATITNGYGASGSMASLPEGGMSPPMSPTILNGATPISYPSFGSSSSSTYSLPSASSSSVTIRSPGTPYSSSSVSLSSPYDKIASPPQASINPSLSGRRRMSDYVDQSQEALSGALSPGSGGVGAGVGGSGGVGSPGGAYGHGLSLSSAGNQFGAGINGINGYGGGNMNGYNGSPNLSGAYNGLGGVNGTLSLSSLPRKPIDYPELSASISSAHQIVRPPPAAAGALERQDNRLGSPPVVPRTTYPSPGGGSGSAGSSPATTGVSGAINPYPVPSSNLSSTTTPHPTSTSISSSVPYSSTALTKLGLPALQPVPRLKGGEWPPRYWADSPIGTSGLKNLGNTCYMNAPIQCLSATAPFARFFTEVDLKTVINYMNKMNSQGQLTRAFSRLIHDIWHGDMPYIAPNDFRRTLCSLNKQYIGTDQHDSQEFLSFLLDGIHEDTNRIMAKKPLTRTPEEEERLESLPQQVASDYEWQVWRQSNDSIIVDFFQGQFRNQLRCMSCSKTSTTYNAFSILSLPVPARTGKIPLQNCLKAFFNTEVMEGDDAWDCTRCKVKRRATKTLSLARLPPVLVIHFKRFEANGRFSDKIDTFVDFPVKSLDLTDLMPPPLPSGADQSLLNGGQPMSREDPRTQLGPYKYDLYGVTNHYGNLSSGHYTAFVASRGGWLYCDDSSVKNVDSKQVVNQKAYVLFYKRTKV